MAERTSASLESLVEELTARLTRLEVRVAELEARPVGAGKKAVTEAFEPAIAGPSVPQGTLALVGRTLLVLAGAYLVRALTDGHVLPAAAGVALGLAYAAAFQLLADREALAGRHASAVFHDVASSAIAFPLIWEATARFALPPRVGYAALVAFFALGIGVAWHRRLRANAVVTTLLALATAVALLVSTHDLIAAMAALVAIAAGVEWLAWRGAWLGLRWAAAVVLDAVAAPARRGGVAAGLARGLPAAVALGMAEAALLALPALYVASVAARTLRHGEAVTAFEVVQGAARPPARLRRRDARARGARPAGERPRRARARSSACSATGRRSRWPSAGRARAATSTCTRPPAGC